MDAGRHPNITLLTLSETKEIKGEPGDFTARILKHPRYVDIDECTSCNDCSNVCSVSTINKFELGLSFCKAIFKSFPQAVPGKFAITKLGWPPCRYTCPAGVNAQGYIALISQDKYDEALELERRDNPFPAVCGRVCTHPCEKECKRKVIDEPLAIAQLKRFIADRKPESEEKKPKAELTKEKVAILGAGPAGLSCAYFLARRGYRSVVFEATNHSGGLLYWAIPRFRLPEKELQRDLNYIKSWGVEIKMNTVLGKDFGIQDLFDKNFKAVFLGLGAAKEKKMGIEGEDLKGVELCVEFLKKAVHDRKTPVGKKVAVVGGGNSAVDAARTALRLGAEEAFIVYRRSRREMPANEEEIIEAEKEGVKINYLTNPTKIIDKDERVVGMACIKMKLGEPDASGRRRPSPIKGSEFTIDVDMVILAIGQAADITFLNESKEKFRITRWGTFEVDPDTLQTTIPGVFAGGDVVTGPATVIEAIAAGKEAAESIDRYIQGIDLKEGRTIKQKRVQDEDIDIPENIEMQEREKMPLLELKKAKVSFNEVTLGFTDKQAKKEANRCLNCAICCECRECEKVCEPNAVRLDMQDEVVELDVGAVIIATGIDYKDPVEASEYGYHRFKNVITSFELERLLSAGGPTKGELIRFTDNKPPKKIAFINCVGSRNMRRDIPYCSRICCMNAIKDSLIIKEYIHDAEIYIFYIDIRAFGKGFEELYNRSLREGIKYIKGKPSKVIEDPDTGNLILSFENQNTIKSEKMTVDMVVLSSAIIPAAGAKGLAKILGVEIEKDGFFKQKDVCGYPLESTRDGIYLCGCATGPKDITDSIAEASGAAAKAALLVEEKVEEKETEIPQRDISGEPRIGVFVCHCGLNIAGLLSCESLAEYAKTLKNVVFSEDVLFACAESTQRQIQERIKEYYLNRVVVAACTPKTHEPIFQETLSKVGLNPYLFDMVNIRDQCSWVHLREPDAATKKAKDLIRMAVARARLLVPLNKREMEVGQKILVIGGGIAGIQTVIDMANRGFEVHLVEKESVLGGRVSKLASLYPRGESGKELANKKIFELQKLDVYVYTDTEVQNIQGFVGNFDVELRSKAQNESTHLKIDAIILALGSDLYQPDETHGYRKFKNVCTNMELEQMLLQQNLPDRTKSIAFIQCVGSRTKDGNPGCSRYCCQAAIKQAILLKEKGIDVAVFHRGIRVYAKGAEMMYRKAREIGVLFLPYSEDSLPDIKGEDKAEYVEVYSTDLNTKIAVSVDTIVLSVGMIPKLRESQRLSEILKVPKGQDGFFLERHPKFGPVETSVNGVFLCGCCQFPQDIADSIVQASAVASRVSALLGKGVITLEPIVSSVDEILCRGCARCAEICEFTAIEIVEKENGIYVARVNEALCKGCGSCCGVCPTGAIDLRHFKIEQIKAQLEALFE